MPPVPDAGANAFLSASFTKVLSGASVYAFDVLIDTYDVSANYTKLADIQMPGNYAFYVQLDSGNQIVLVEQFPNEDGSFGYGQYTPTPSVALASGVWHRVELSTEPTATDSGVGFATLTVDHENVVPNRAIDVPIPVGAPQIDMGIFWPVAGESAWRVHFDNVVFDIP
jgi:hypothetical protein